MKRIISILLGVLTAVFMLSGCGQEAGNENFSGMANPWVETDADGIRSTLGFTMEAPEGATDVVYQMIETEKLGEMMFVYDNLSFTYRIQPADELTDISGMYYQWDKEDDCKVGDLDAKSYRYASEMEYADLILWYNESEKLTYSLSTFAPNLSGFDIIAVAEAVYK